MIVFNVPPKSSKAIEYIQKAIDNQKICGDGEFTKLCNNWFQEKFDTPAALLTTSCTHALEMAAILANISEGDEVIMPSFTFCSTADAFVMRGAKIKFIDIRPDTMNMDENLIEEAITPRTKAIVPVHYAGISCEMDRILEIAKKYNLYVIEDAAQGVMSTYKGKALGTIGDFGCYSFHETKNYSMGEGGALLMRDRSNLERAEIIREKGTNRSNFLRGQVDKYTWVDFGSSYLPSDMLAAYLYAQLEEAESINEDRIRIWNQYNDGLQDLALKGKIILPTVPSDCVHNAHMFYIKVKDIVERTTLIKFLRDNDILSVFHYIPLHSAPAGEKYGEFVGEDIYTTKESERLMRLPLYFGLKEDEVEYIISKIYDFYK
ncbi:MAG: TDP-4-oxo-6-deoxy-D-glucose aminotransferase [Bacillales bacterium]|jgi:dTDP-4-amino-4,6-dideoxygalactose transaminase|nr:TDP-4-oxo-6-deoxy-D-glucose aminotransferase [Bacillales bacterium]